MKKIFIHTFLIIVISSFILVFPAYLRCSNLKEVNLFPTDLSFENPDQDGQFIDQQQNESNGYLLDAFSILFLQGTNTFKQAHTFLFFTSFVDQISFNLRC